ncbi:transcriptional regulator, MarR family [Psychromonas ingrahamii 37]|uniref:Transcriptional regulator, MarR family n=1 Tax=Psychromonas ingrahamii (strain DSM 17664 / CCUG 51855 / 37) TaxID=357804 RepID=A1SX39_PSYIN|nr:MarR family transcriptional regulator [Psychromonas ingrahamii]ABM04054.1 transcriptional regulator, MarR family [Psychromonas ingrahamii 37]
MTKQHESSNFTLEKQICFSLYSASNAMGRAYRPLLKKLDLTYLQYIVMMVLWQYSTMNVKALGGKVHLDSGTLTPLLKRLESKGLIIRSRSQQDERVRIISLSDEGQTMRQQAEQVPNAMLCKTKMTIDELTKLKQGCDLLLANLNN